MTSLWGEGSPRQTSDAGEGRNMKVLCECCRLNVVYDSEECWDCKSEQMKYLFLKRKAPNRIFGAQMVGDEAV
jgi:hypothetical protein